MTTLVLPPSNALQEQAQELRRYCSSLGEAGQAGASQSLKEERKQVVGRQALPTGGAVHHSILPGGPQLEPELMTEAAIVGQVGCGTAAAPRSAWHGSMRCAQHIHCSRP